MAANKIIQITFSFETLTSQMWTDWETISCNINIEGAKSLVVQNMDFWNYLWNYAGPVEVEVNLDGSWVKIIDCIVDEKVLPMNIGIELVNNLDGEPTDITGKHTILGFRARTRAYGDVLDEQYVGFGSVFGLIVTPTKISEATRF